MIDVDLVKGIRALAERIIISEDMELVDMEYRLQGKNWLLRFYIDREGGVTLDDCADISRQLSVAFDIEDLIPHKYLLEVSSPGINRPLVKDSDYKKYVGEKVKLKTSNPIEGRRNFSGILTGFSGEIVELTADNTVFEIKRADIEKARLNIDVKFK
jgi:ribosome maturation factor RimP